MLGILSLLVSGIIIGKESLHNNMIDTRDADRARAEGKNYYINHRGKYISLETGEICTLWTRPSDKHMILSGVKSDRVYYDFTQERIDKIITENQIGKKFKIKGFMNDDFSSKGMVYLPTDEEGKPYIFGPLFVNGYWNEQKAKRLAEKFGLEWGNGQDQYNGKGMKYIDVKENGHINYYFTGKMNMYNITPDRLIRNREQQDWNEHGIVR